MSQQKARRIILTAAFTAISATGAWYGAGLKTKHEVKQVTKRRREATTAEKIALLEEQRSILVGKEKELQWKMDKLEKKRRGEDVGAGGMGREWK